LENKLIKKPNLFIAGYAKSGTTALYNFFLEHEDICCNKFIKEPRYFSYSYFKKTSAFKYILNKAVKSEKEYLKLYKKCNDEKYILDSSVYYSFFKGIAKQINNFNPEAKIILILRNPVKRFYSHYMMHLKSGFKKVDINEFIENPISSEGISILEIGNYYTSIKEYFEVFGKQNVLILLHDNLEKTPYITYQKICKFLNVKYYKYDNKIVNVSGKPKSIFFIKLLRFIKMLIPQIIIKRIQTNKKMYFNKMLYNDMTLKREQMPIEVKKQLINYYIEDIKKVEKLTNEELHLWYEV